MPLTLTAVLEYWYCYILRCSTITHRRDTNGEIMRATCLLWIDKYLDLRMLTIENLMYEYYVSILNEIKLSQITP